MLTDAPAKVIVDKWSIDQAIDWEDKKIKEIYDTLGAIVGRPGATRHPHRAPSSCCRCSCSVVGSDRLPVLPGGLAVVHRQARRLSPSASSASATTTTSLKDDAFHAGRPQQPRLHGGARWASRSLTGLGMALVLNSVIARAQLLPRALPAALDHLHRASSRSPGAGCSTPSRARVLQQRAARRGSPAAAVAFMATPEGAMMAVIVANWWRGFPFFGVSYLAGMARHPAGALRGGLGGRGRRGAALLAHHAARAQARRSSSRPCCRFIMTINDFNIIYVMTRGGPGSATQVFATYSYQVALPTSSAGAAA